MSAFNIKSCVFNTAFVLDLYPAKLIYLNVIYLKLCLAIHNFKWVKITHIWDHFETNHLQLMFKWSYISFPIPVI